MRVAEQDPRLTDGVVVCRRIREIDLERIVSICPLSRQTPHASALQLRQP
jgi:hypothetical protein